MFDLPGFISLTSLWLTGVIVCFYLYLKLVTYNYWNKMKVPHVPPNLILGNIDLDFILDKITIGT